MQKDIKGKTRYEFTHVATNEIVSGVFVFEDEDGIFIRTDDYFGEMQANFGIHPMGLVSGEWSYKVN